MEGLCVSLRLASEGWREIRYCGNLTGRTVPACGVVKCSFVKKAIVKYKLNAVILAAVPIRIAVIVLCITMCYVWTG
jgi:hypothetical protein